MRPILPFIIKGKFGNHRFIIVPSTTRFKRRTAGKSLIAYAKYAKGWQPEEVVEMDHTDIARRLMLEHGLTQDAADFAADQILLVAARIDDREP